MTIKEIRKMTGLSQADFAITYNIPLSNIKQWESRPGSTSYHNPPKYVPLLLERVIRAEREAEIIKEYQRNEKELISKRLQKYQELMELL